MRLGTVLIQKGLVEKEKVQEIIHAQITETVVQLFGWKQGTYAFSAQGVPQDKELPFSLDTQHLLMEGLRIVDELSAIKDRLTLDTLFRRTSAEGAGLDKEEQEILALVDGENDVSTIIDLAGMDNYEVSRILLSLTEKGLIESVRVAPVISAGEAPAEEKAPSALYGYLPYLVVAASLIFSLVVVFIQKDETLKVFSAAKTVDELRFTIEKFRLQHDAYPRTLSELTDARDPWGYPFIYSHGILPHRQGRRSAERRHRLFNDAGNRRGRRPRTVCHNLRLPPAARTGACICAPRGCRMRSAKTSCRGI
jgi:hypothetical protein